MVLLLSVEFCAEASMPGVMAGGGVGGGGSYGGGMEEGNFRHIGDISKVVARTDKGDNATLNRHDPRNILDRKSSKAPFTVFVATRIWVSF